MFIYIYIYIYEEFIIDFDIFKNHVFYYAIMFLLCFIVLCLIEINWNAQWKNMIFENV